MIYDLDNEYGARIIGDGGESTTGTFQVTSGAAGTPALFVARSANGTASIAPVRISAQSNASAAMLGFNAAISLTSIVLTTVANTDYAIPVEINGEARYIPVFKAAALIGAAAY